MTRDRIENAVRRLHTSALHNTTVEVFDPSVDYEAGDGYSVSYPDDPSATYDARVEAPSPNEDKQRSGTDVEIDAVVRVRDDTEQQWTGWGEDGDAASHVRDTADGTGYEVQSVRDEHDGLTTLEVVET